MIVVKQVVNDAKVFKLISLLTHTITLKTSASVSEGISIFRSLGKHVYTKIRLIKYKGITLNWWDNSKPATAKVVV